MDKQAEMFGGRLPAKDAPTGPRVWNKRDPKTPRSAVYIGRPSIWGNPYSHLAGTKAAHKVATRGEAVARFEAALKAKIARDPDALSRLRAALKGHDLVCWCAPHACHGDVLLRYANEDDDAPPPKKNPA